MSFNDPFECRPLAYFDMEDPRSDEWFRSQLKSRGVKKPSERFLFKRRFRKEWGKPRPLREPGFEGKWILESTGIYSLTLKPDDTLMWAHYASEHMGVCIRFDTQQWPFNLAWKVDYATEYPIINGAIDSGDETLKKSVLTKALCWKYEAEWRLIMRTLDPEERRRLAGRSDQIAQWTLAEWRPGIYQIPTTAIREVIFGLRVPSEEKERIAVRLQEAQSTAKCFEVRRSVSTYQLEIFELHPRARTLNCRLRRRGDDRVAVLRAFAMWPGRVLDTHFSHRRKREAKWRLRRA